MTRVAFKRLAAVEIDPDASHQHEFNAGALRRELKFPTGRTEGQLSLLFYPSDGKEPGIEYGMFTLYDARERHPTRSEYRLYYSTACFNQLVRNQLVRPGDLLILLRDSDSGGLHGIIAAQGTSVERQMLAALSVADSEVLQRFVFRGNPKPRSTDASELVQALLPFPVRSSLNAAARAHPLYVSAVNAAALPPTKQMAQAGREIAEIVWGRGLDGDDFITRGLEAETELFFLIEREVGTRSLEELMGRDAADLDSVLSWAMRLQQARKARRGQSLQHHFGFLLERHAIPFTAQCTTERGETPDFVIPGMDKYLDSNFPPHRLRMVACKSTVRERWGQILKEADRIPCKYLLTLDPDLTLETVMNMRLAGLFPFLPLEVIKNSYASHPAHELLGNVGTLLGNLRAVL